MANKSIESEICGKDSCEIGKEKRETNCMVNENLSTSAILEVVNDVNDAQNIPENEKDHENCPVNIKIESDNTNVRIMKENVVSLFIYYYQFYVLLCRLMFNPMIPEQMMYLDK